MDKPLKSLKFPGLPDTYVIPEAKDGASAYDLAVQQGFTGSLDDWLASLKGDPGTDFTVKAYYESLPALESAVPTPSDGDAYGVGTSAPYDIYVWDAVHSEWVNNGQIQGPSGEDGKDGITFTPSVSADGLLSWSNDGGVENPAPVNIKGATGDTGSTGETGATGTTFTPAVSASGVISWTNDGGKTNPDSVNIVDAVLAALPTWTGGSY